ncbi:hypothetical protein HAX54_035256 [Datura stramonium]|uniref:Uncharacterized protein n=1 Tax=Datura stramonium TaxID=4076 RepID=A0ABS8VIW2_DATST|nr:hypothetical protein [Datura stramonium]
MTLDRITVVVDFKEEMTVHPSKNGHQHGHVSLSNEDLVSDKASSIGEESSLGNWIDASIESSSFLEKRGPTLYRYLRRTTPVFEEPYDEWPSFRPFRGVTDVGKRVHEERDNKRVSRTLENAELSGDHDLAVAREPVRPEPGPALDVEIVLHHYTTATATATARFSKYLVPVRLRINRSGGFGSCSLPPLHDPEGESQIVISASGTTHAVTIEVVLAASTSTPNTGA